MTRAADRFWSKVLANGDCWEWQGFCWTGYGRFWLDGRHVYAHRYAYELLVGPIPSGLTLDHICRNRRCVNPDHLEPVTQRVNNERAAASASTANAAKTHCPRQHPYDEVNTMLSSGRRYCRTCMNDLRRERRRRARAAA